MNSYLTEGTRPLGWSVVVDDRSAPRIREPLPRCGLAAECEVYHQAGGKGPSPQHSAS